MANSLFHLVRNAVLSAGAILLLAQAPAAAADDVLSVYLGAHTPPLMNALNLIAQGAGFYKDDHLNVTTYRVANANAAGAMCAHGQADICPGDIEAGISGYPHGDFLRMFLTRASKFGYVVAVLDSSPIKTLAQVKGNIIGVHNTVSSAVSNVGGALASLGLKPGDYSLSERKGGSPERKERFGIGQVQFRLWRFCLLSPTPALGLSCILWVRPMNGTGRNRPMEAP